MDGLEATRRLKQDAGTQTASSSSPPSSRTTTVFEALRAGASGLLLKNARPEELVPAVRIVAAGDALLAPSITRRVIQEYFQRPARHKNDAGLDLLTERELEVLRLLATGTSNLEIATHLYLGGGTIRTHVSHMLAKLACATECRQSCSPTKAASPTRAKAESARPL
jgi:DNA-binding NarL/FixJ family response regulator